MAGFFLEHILGPLLFCVDLLAYQYFEYPCTQFLLAFVVTLFFQKQPSSKAMIGILLLLLQDCVMLSSFEYTLLYLGLLVLIGSSVVSVLNEDRVGIYYAFVLIVSLFRYGCIYEFYGSYLYGAFTNIQFLGIIIGAFIVQFLSEGKKGDRF